MTMTFLRKSREVGLLHDSRKGLWRTRLVHEGDLLLEAFVPEMEIYPEDRRHMPSRVASYLALF